MRGLLAILAGLGLLPVGGAEHYDPMQKPDGMKVVVRDLVMTDRARTREIPLRVYYREGVKAAPVVLFSHGLGGSRANNRYLGEHLAARGYVMVALQHAGSDEAVWKGVAPLKRREALTKAASGQSSRDRHLDVVATLDQLGEWNGEEAHPLHGRLNLARVGMSGHSFGAVTTQAVSGQVFGLGGARFTDQRIDAALALSPSPPPMGEAAKAFGAVGIPWMVMTGTKDQSAIGRTTPEKRREVFAHLPAGGKYELVLHDAEHMAFGDRTLRGRDHRNPDHHQIILALATAFWDSYLMERPAAKAWLDGEGAAGVVGEKDLWQAK